MTTPARKAEFRGTPDVVVYGRRAVMEAIEAESVEIERVLVAASAPAAFRKELSRACRDPHGNELIPFEQVPGRIVHELSGDSRNDQGVAAKVHLGGVIDAYEYLDTLKGRGARNPSRILAVDNVTNPQNLGMIVRCAVGLGMSGVLWPSVGTPWVNGLIIKASAGLLYHANVITCHTLEEGLVALQSGGFSLAGLVAEGNTLLHNHEPAHRQVYVMGSETTGLTNDVQSMLDEQLRIDMVEGAESLNVAVAAGILCHAVGVRQ